MRRPRGGEERAAAAAHRFISASELGEYAYCRRAWWLRAVRGVTVAEQGTRFRTGHEAHRRHGALLRLARLLALAALLALVAALALLWSTTR